MPQGVPPFVGPRRAGLSGRRHQHYNVFLPPLSAIHIIRQYQFHEKKDSTAIAIGHFHMKFMGRQEYFVRCEVGMHSL